MASEMDWRSSLSSSTRYENIQALKASIELAEPSHPFPQKQAFAIENEAYKTSNTLIGRFHDIPSNDLPLHHVCAQLLEDVTLAKVAALDRTAEANLEKDEYIAACQYTAQPEPEPELAVSQQNEPAEVDEQTSDISIGQYGNCHYVASGVTAEVYRSGNRALKVITETRNIEPHNPAREAKILATLRKSCVPLLETFRDQEQRFVLVFTYMPTSLEALIAQGSISLTRVQKHFIDLFGALSHIHAQGIIHRDIKPSAVLLASPDGPAYLSDFGTAWHPTMSVTTEAKDQKILDIGTGAYRAPEVLFGNKAYGTAVDMWGAGAMLAECSRNPPKTLFESRPVHEDGNQLGLILSIFKTLGSPTRESWPEAANFRTPPFDMYRSFEQRTWEEILPDTKPDFRSLVAKLVHYNSSRATAVQALELLAGIQVDSPSF